MDGPLAIFVNASLLLCTRVRNLSKVGTQIR